MEHYRSRVVRVKLGQEWIIVTYVNLINKEISIEKDNVRHLHFFLLLSVKFQFSVCKKEINIYIPNWYFL